MLVTLFLTRYLMPVLYSYFPAPIGVRASTTGEIVESSHYADEFLAHLPEERPSRS
jgi:cobalt-zinc-cadmium resistance protein CzcA